jgi:translation initiation factor 5B
MRHPIVAVLGHVDHGKTSLLDRIRGTSVAAREPGAITQWIGASMLPAETIERRCGDLLDRLKFKIIVPGILFVDTPGHETFSNLRRRGGSAADIAVLVVDVLKGVEPQTVESVNILKARRTPFVVAANKIDMILGWRSVNDRPFTEAFAKQAREVQTSLDEYIYRILGSLSRLGLKSERFDRISDFRTNIAIVPTSAKTGEGIPELLSTLVGLTQAYMKDELMTTTGPAKGTVLEVKEEPGLGVTVNVIIFDGVFKIGDKIVLGGRQDVIETYVRAILLPKPLDEIRDPRDKFSNVTEIAAAAGIKIVAPNLDQALAGSPIYAVPEGESSEKLTSQIRDEVQKLRIETDKLGVVLKADTLGSLEAITTSLEALGIPIRFADVGDVSRREVVEAKTVMKKDRLLGVVLAFNVKTLPDAAEEAAKEKVPIFQADIIYHMLEDFTRWKDKEKTAGIKAELDLLIRPGRLRILPGCIFRRSKPAIVGVEVLAGRIRRKYPLLLESGRPIGEIDRIQDKGKEIEEALAGTQVAISLDDAVVGRHIDEGDVLIVSVPEDHARKLLVNFKNELSSDEISFLEESLKGKTVIGI